jgi:hypothetical protein
MPKQQKFISISTAKNGTFLLTELLRTKVSVRSLTIFLTAQMYEFPAHFCRGPDVNTLIAAFKKKRGL